MIFNYFNLLFNLAYFIKDKILFQMVLSKYSIVIIIIRFIFIVNCTKIIMNFNMTFVINFANIYYSKVIYL